MTIQWSFDENRSAMRWTDMTGKADQPSDANESEMNGSYLAPLPDFASHSPFGGATWFTPHLIAVPELR